MKTENISRILYLLSLITFGFYSSVWIFLNFFPNEYYFDLFSDSYGFIALWGALSGVAVSKLWGGFSSKLGSSIFWFSVGLLFQFLGQLVSAYYRQVLHIETPYPSIAEFFYFGSIFIYGYAVYFLSHLAGVRLSINLNFSRTLALVIPGFMLLLAYKLFLADYSFEETPILVIFLDFAYPVLQAIQVSMAILTSILIVKLMGGHLKFPSLALVISLLMQYFADTYFTYKIIHSEVQPGGISDSLYLLAYFSMSVSLFLFVVTFTKLNSKYE